MKVLTAGSTPTYCGSPADDRTDAGRTGSERPDNPGTKQAAKRIADLEREIEQRKQSREYRSIADKIKANRGTIDQRDRQQEKSRRRSRGMVQHNNNPVYGYSSASFP